MRWNLFPPHASVFLLCIQKSYPAGRLKKQEKYYIIILIMVGEGKVTMKGFLRRCFLIFMVSPKQAMLFILVFLLLQQIEGNLIYPHVVGNSVGLPSIWVLAAVSIGGSLMGIVGMLIFIPLMSVFYALFREVVYIKLRQKKIYPQDIG